MSQDEKAAGFGWVVGILCFVAILLWMIDVSEARWHQNVLRARTHIPNHWARHRGVVVKQDQPNFADRPPDRPSIIQFPDYYGRTTRFRTPLAYRSEAQDTVEVDVASDGNIYIPDSTTGNDQVPENPMAAHVEFWPAWGIFFFGIAANAIISFFIGLIAYAIAESLAKQTFRGRLSVR